MNAWQIRPATPDDAAAWVALRSALWPETSAAEHAAEAQQQIAAPQPGHLTLLALADGRAIGFAETALRHDYVNGTAGSPVAFLEGWYVAPEWRGRGVGRALVAAVEDWARAQGCIELASDALLDNIASHNAHRACGFAETERVVYFCKRLER